MKKTKTFCSFAALVSLAVMLAVPFAHGDVICENDFSMRTSAAASGHAVDPSHGYRFVAKTEVGKSHYDLAVCDMDVEQPTLATAIPAEPVATFSALPFRRTALDQDGISCISISTCNNPNSAYDRTLSARVDNLRVEYSKIGATVPFR